MGFKLGSSKQPYAVSGEVKHKLRFHREAGDPDISVPGTPIIRTELESGILGEANNDGSIFINSSMVPNSEEEKQVVMHEMIHAKDMKTGKLNYTDHAVTWNGINYPRKKGKILYNEEWLPEGSKIFPWEKMPWDAKENTI